MKKIISSIKGISALLLMAAVMSVGVTLFSLFHTALAAPPSTPYNLGETLAPNCVPGSSNCTVVTPAASGPNSDITSLSALTTPLSISQGGTETGTTPTDGQLLIGKTDGTYGIATLSEGANVNIAEGDGSITIAASADGYSLDAADGSPTDAVFVDNDGNMGIGTSTPLAKTHLSGGTFLQTPDTSSLTEIAVLKDGVGATELAGADGMFVAGKYAYVASGTDSALSIIDISDPANPTEVGVIKDGVGATGLEGAIGVFVAGKYAYVIGNTDDSLAVIDVSDPSNPSEVSVLVDDNKGGAASGLDAPNSLFVAGKYAYIASQFDNAVTVIDISDPTNLTEVGIIQDGVGATELGNANGIFVSGQYAYVAAIGDSALSVIDISDPANPTEVGVIKDGVGATELGGAAAVYVTGKYAYISSGFDNALSVIDISDPANPTEVGVIKDGVGATELEGAFSVDIAGNYAYVVSLFDNAITLIDISDPANPTEVGVIKDGVGATELGGVSGIRISGKYAYTVSLFDSAFSVIDISGIHAPSAHIGTLESNQLVVSEQLLVGNSGYIQNSLNVGLGGILSDGLICDGFGNCLNSNGHALDAVDGDPTDVVFVDNDGKVGIGTVTPSELLEVSGNSLFKGQIGIGDAVIDTNRSLNLDVTSTEPTSKVYGEYVQLTQSVGNNNSLYGGRHSVNYTSSSASTGILLGEAGSANNNNSGTLTAMYGGHFSSYNNSTGSTFVQHGINTQAANLSTGTSNILAGVYSRANNPSGTVTNMYGGNFLVDQDYGTGGTTTNATGLKYTLSNNHVSSSITTAKGLDLSGWVNAGTIDTSYGIYIDNSIDVGSTSYSIYSDSNSDSYFAGNVGIGTSSPDSPLHVKGANPGMVLQTTADDDYGITWQNIGGTGIGEFVQHNSTGDFELRTLGGGAGVLTHWDYLNGYVGINKTPSAMLDINGPVAGGDIIRLGTTGASAVGDEFRINWNSFGWDLGYIGSAFEDGTGNSVLTFATSRGANNTVEAMRIDSAGNVGIGTTTPNATLEVAGIFTAGFNNTIALVGGDPNFAFGENNNVSSGHNSFASGENNTISSWRATALGYGNFISGSAAFAFGNENTASNTNSFAGGWHNEATGYASVALGQYVDASADNSVVVGHGLGDLNQISNNTQNSLMIGFNSDTPTLFVGPSSGAGTTGNVGIGTASPNTKLDVAGALSLREMAAPAVSPLDEGRIYFDSTEDKFKVSQNNGAYVDLVNSDKNSLDAADGNPTDVLFIDNDGNVGIGTLSPSALLDTNFTSTSTTAASATGNEFNVTDTGIVTTGTDTTLGFDLNVTRTGATGGTINTTGLDLDVTGDAGGISTAVGLDVNVSGSDTNYAAIFQGGNVGIGTATPQSVFQIKSAGNQMRISGISTSDDSEIQFWDEAAERGFIKHERTGYIFELGGTAGVSTSIYGGGSEAIRINTNQLVGLGIAPTSAKLEIDRTTTGSSNPYLNLSLNSSTLFTSYLENDWTLDLYAKKAAGDSKFALNTDDSLYFNMDANNDETGENFIFAHNGIGSAGTELLRITEAGNVGVGTTSPNTKLDVAGAFSMREMVAPAVSPLNEGRIYFDSIEDKFKVSQNNGAYVDLVNSDKNSLDAADGSPTDALFVDNNGNVGIGTTSPPELLQVGRSASSGNYYVAINASIVHEAGIKFKSGATGPGAESSKIYRPAGFDDLRAWTTTTGDIATFKQDGKVGIGTTSPNEKLEVTGNALITDNLKFTADAGEGVVTNTADTTDTAILNFSGGGAAGVDRGALVQLAGNEATAGSEGVLVLAAGDDAAAGEIRFYTENFNEKMRIERDGKVGIGTVAPQSTLHVPDGKYAQFEDNNAGAPPAADCDADSELGRLSIDTVNNRLYVCMGVTRGWDYFNLTD